MAVKAIDAQRKVARNVRSQGRGSSYMDAPPSSDLADWCP